MPLAAAKIHRLTYLHSIGYGCLLQQLELVAAAGLQPELTAEMLAYRSPCLKPSLVTSHGT